jgi:tetratricopeptide (TPR) repeat protein
MSRVTFRATLACVVMCLMGIGPMTRPAQAHDSPEHVIEALTDRMEREGRSASLLCRRAEEYRALGRLNEAVIDLHSALKLEPTYVPVYRELCLARLAQDRDREAMSAVNFAINRTPSEEPEHRAPLYLLRAQVHAKAGRDAEALADCERAIARRAEDIDGYLLRAQLQSRLGQWDSCLQGLTQGREQTGSAVLEVEFIETLIDAGRAKEALARIEPELREARWRSGWLLRRGRALLRLGHKERGRQDLRAAIAEMNTRIRPTRPDLMLIMERGLAHALLGERTKARNDLTAAEKGGIDGWLTHRLREALAALSLSLSAEEIASLEEPYVPHPVPGFA